MQVVEKEAESGGKLGDLDSYEIEGGETKGEILQNLAEFQFSCVSHAVSIKTFSCHSIYIEDCVWAILKLSFLKCCCCFPLCHYQWNHIHIYMRCLRHKTIDELGLD